MTISFQNIFSSRKKVILLVSAIFLVSSFLIFAGTALAVDPPSSIYVDKTGLDENSGTQEYPFLTIQAAINAVAEGGTVNVAAGTYTNDIWDSSLGDPVGYRITKSVTLLGAQAGVDPAGSTEAREGGKQFL